MQHRCAVCWQEQPDHKRWYTHATVQHGATLSEFGFENCRANPRDCTGVQHMRKLSTYGQPRRRETTPVKPFKAKDGTKYTPQRLPDFS